MSAFAFGGVPARVLRSALSTSEVCVSENLLAEYRSVPDALRAARKVDAEQWQALLAGIAAFVAEAHLVEPKRPVRVCRDPKDDMVLECCCAAGARYLITGDRDRVGQPACEGVRHSGTRNSELGTQNDSF